jgi:hypothetical protein
MESIKTEVNFIEINTNSGIPALINISQIVAVRNIGGDDNEIILTAKDKDGVNITIETKVYLKKISDLIKG